jgi:predicted TIM-barrel fold metal-dependent hydrolase
MTAGVAGATMFGLSSRDARAQRSSPQARGTFIDMHTHLGQGWGDRPALSAGALVQWMNQHKIDKAVVLPLENPESWDHPVSTHYVLEETETYRDRLIPFCSIDPRTINLGSLQAKVDQLEKYVDAGARGFGEHKPGIAMNDPRNREIFAACSEVGLPVLFHLDSHRNTDEPGLPGLEQVLQEFPDTNFIGHAQGWWGSISGDLADDQMQSYPETDVQPGGAIDRLMDNYDNIYGDLSAGSGANAITRDLEFGREFLIRNADRLLFGTDYLAPGQEVPQFELYTETLDLPEDVERKIFRDNARELLELTS